MKVTIEVNDATQAQELLKAPEYLAMLEDFWDWINGEGREASAQDVREKLTGLAAIYGVAMT